MNLFIKSLLIAGIFSVGSYGTYAFTSMPEDTENLKSSADQKALPNNIALGDNISQTSDLSERDISHQSSQVQNIVVTESSSNPSVTTQESSEQSTIEDTSVKASSESTDGASETDPSTVNQTHQKSEINEESSEDASKAKQNTQNDSLAVTSS